MISLQGNRAEEYDAYHAEKNYAAAEECHKAVQHHIAQIKRLSIDGLDTDEQRARVDAYLSDMMADTFDVILAHAKAEWEAKA